MTRFGCLLLICSLSLLIARSGYDELRGAAYVDQGELATLTTFQEFVESSQHAEGNADDDKEESWPGSATSTLPASLFRAMDLLTDGRDQLPAPAKFLHAQLRAPPFA